MSEALKCHARKIIGSFVGLSSDRLHLLQNLPEGLQDLLLRKEEQGNKERDQWGNFEHAYAKNYQEGRLWQPEVDLFALEERKRLSSLPLLPLWPPGYSFALVLTHDVDHIDLRTTPTMLIRMLKRAGKSLDLSCRERAEQIIKTAAKFFLKRPALLQNAKGTLQESLRIEKKLGVTASYFFTVYPLDQYSKYDCLYSLQDTILFEGKKTSLAHVIRQMDEEGFDVGLHGSYFSALDPALLIRQKTVLEQFLGKEVATTRQHWLHFKLPHTLQYQAKSGLKADTTLGYNRNIGYRAGTGFPLNLFDYAADKPLPLLEVPMIIQDGALFGSNALEYSVEKSFDVMKGFLEGAENSNGCLTLLFHPDIFLKKGVSELYEAIICQALKQGAWVTNVKTLARYWQERCKILGYNNAHCDH